MPTIDERIAAAKAVAAACKKRLEEHSLTTKMQEAEAKAENLQATREKHNADQRRREDSRAKIILGAAVLLLSPARLCRVMIELIAVLTARDREWIRAWCASRKFSLDQTEGASEPALDSEPINVPVEPTHKAPEASAVVAASGTELSAVQQPPQSPVPESARKATCDLSSSDPKSPEEMSCQDPVGEALERAISGLHEGDISMFSPEILKNANEADRKVLEAWFASLTQPRPPAVEGMNSPDAVGRVSGGEAVQLQGLAGCPPAAEGMESPDAEDRVPAPESEQSPDAGDRVIAAEGVKSPDPQS